MKKKLLFCLIVCICFVIALTKQNVYNSGEFVLGNIEALSQTENEPPFNQLLVKTGQNCMVTGPDGNTYYWGMWHTCVVGWTICSPECRIFW
jgi:hypothetical protein